MSDTVHGMLRAFSGILFALNTIICTHYVIVRPLKFYLFFFKIIRADFLAFCSLWRFWHLFLDIRGFWWQIKMVSQDCCFSFWQVGTWSILCLKRQPVAQTGHFKWPVDEYPRVANGVYCPARCSNQCGNNFQLYFNLHSRVTDSRKSGESQKL